MSDTGFVATRHGNMYYQTIACDACNKHSTPFVLLHGNTMTVASQERLARRFTDEYTVVCLELLGHGQSASPPNLFGNRYFALQGEAISDVLTTLFTSAVPVFGMSAGAIAALNAICCVPHLIATLILDGVFATVSQQTLHAHRTAMQQMSTVWQRYMYRQHGAEQWHILNHGLLKTIETLATSGETVTPCLESIRVPVLLFQGGRDEFCPEEQGRAVAARIPHTRYIYDSTASHILAWHYPDAFRELVRTFLHS